MLAAVTNSIDVLLNVADTTGESLIGDENLAAAKTNFKNADNAEVKLPLHVIDMKKGFNERIALFSASQGIALWIKTFFCTKGFLLMTYES